MRSLRQLFCVHWFDEKPSYSYETSSGAIICMSQKTYEVTVQPRVCSKCGLKETRPVGEPVCVGWR